MEIIHERPSQRLHYRVTAPMRVSLDGHALRAVDWSLGGCRLTGFEDDLLEHNGEHTLLCTLPFQGFDITLSAEAKLVRVDTQKREVAFQFTELGERETALMQHFIDDLVRGKMTDVEDTIVRIDTPVTPVPTKPDPNPAEVVPVKRWPIKQFVMVLFYLALGTLVFGYIGLYTFAALFRMEVSSAVVSADRLVVTAPVRGRVQEMPLKAGDVFAAGQTLLVLENEDHLAALRRAASQLAEKEAELAETKVLLLEEERRAKGYALVARNNVRQATSQLEGLELAKENAHLKAERIRTLAKKGLALAKDVEAAELELKSVESNLKRKKIHIQELEELIEGGDSVRLFTSNAFAGRLAEMNARIARLNTEIEFQEKLVSELSNQEQSQGVRAPFSGRLIQRNVLAGATAKLGDELLVLEETGSEHVVAFVTQSEVEQLRVGSVADIFVPAEGR